MVGLRGWELARTASYAGALTVADGTLRLDGTQSAATGQLTLSGPVSGATKSYASGGSNGTTSVLLADTTGLVVGMAVSGTNIQPHTYVRSISGSTVHLTTPTIGQLSGTLVFGGLGGGTLTGSGTHGGSVTVASGGKLVFDLVRNAAEHNRLDIGGAATFFGTTTLTLSGDSNAAPGTYTLLNAAGGITGPLPTLILPPGWTATLASTGTALTLTLHATTPLGSWRHTHFGSSENSGHAADTADYDGDGLQNLMEYALGTDPVAERDSGIITSGLETNTLTLSFTPVQTEGLTYVIEASSDLVDWTEQTELTPVAGQSYIHNDTANLSSSSRRFLRFRVVRP